MKRYSGPGPHELRERVGRGETAVTSTTFQKILKNVVIDVKTFANIKKMYYLCTALHLVRALHIESVFAVLQENVEVFKN